MQTIIKPRIETKLYIRNKGGAGVTSQFEAPNAKVRSDDESHDKPHDAQIKREDCNPSAVGASNVVPTPSTRMPRVCPKGSPKDPTRAKPGPQVGHQAVKPGVPKTQLHWHCA